VIKHPLQNGTPVMVEYSGYKSTGVICDHYKLQIGKAESITYHVAMDWPRVVRRFDSAFVRRL
jgi:hypothetical protein